MGLALLAVGLWVCCALLVRAEAHTRDDAHAGALQAAAAVTGSGAFLLTLAWCWLVGAPLLGNG